jgi:hypothetical protein
MGDESGDLAHALVIEGAIMEELIRRLDKQVDEVSYNWSPSVTCARSCWRPLTKSIAAVLTDEGCRSQISPAVPVFGGTRGTVSRNRSDA